MEFCVVLKCMEMKDLTVSFKQKLSLMFKTTIYYKKEVIFHDSTEGITFQRKFFVFVFGFLSYGGKKPQKPYFFG